jgi:hypothetical protein
LDDGQLKDKNKKPAQQENSKISKELILIPVMIEVLKNITNLICRAVCILQLDLIQSSNWTLELKAQKISFYP